MTSDMINLRDLVEKTPDADLLREMIGVAVVGHQPFDLNPAATEPAQGAHQEICGSVLALVGLDLDLGQPVRVSQRATVDRGSPSLAAMVYFVRRSWRRIHTMTATIRFGRRRRRAGALARFESAEYPREIEEGYWNIPRVGDLGHRPRRCRMGRGSRRRNRDRRSPANA